MNIIKRIVLLTYVQFFRGCLRNFKCYSENSVCRTLKAICANKWNNCIERQTDVKTNYNAAHLGRFNIVLT
jgi:hypothetical protein